MHFTGVGEAIIQFFACGLSGASRRPGWSLVALLRAINSYEGSKEVRLRLLLLIHLFLPPGRVTPYGMGRNRPRQAAMVYPGSEDENALTASRSAKRQKRRAIKLRPAAEVTGCPDRGHP
jgi:hypothetical protein